MDVFQECALAALETLFARGFNRYCSVKYLENKSVSSRLLKKVTCRHKSVMKSLGQSLDLASTAAAAATITSSIKEKQEIWNGSVASFSKVLADKRLLSQMEAFAVSRHEGENLSCLLFYQTRLSAPGNGGGSGDDGDVDLCLVVLFYLTFVDGRAVAVPLNLEEKRKREVRDAIEAFKKSASTSTAGDNNNAKMQMARVVQSLRNVNRDVEMIVYTNTYREYCRSIS